MTFPDPDTGGTLGAKNSNTVWLPTAMFRWGITEDLLARFSYTETFNLPTFAQLNPYTQYFADVTNIGYGTATGGNPDLEPITSTITTFRSNGISPKAALCMRPGSSGTSPARSSTSAMRSFITIRMTIPIVVIYTYILSQPDNAGDSTLDGWEFGSPGSPNCRAGSMAWVSRAA